MGKSCKTIRVKSFFGLKIKQCLIWEGVQNIADGTFNKQVTTFGGFSGPVLPVLKYFVIFLASPPPITGKSRQPGAPYKLGSTLSTIRQAAPTLGQHNEEIFCGRLGLDTSALAGLRRAGII